MKQLQYQWPCSLTGVHGGEKVGHWSGAVVLETMRALRKTSAAFTTWAAAQGYQALPASVTTVSAYVNTLATGGSKPASIRQAVWSVATLHRAAGLVDPTRAEAVRLALKRMARAFGTRQRQAAPLGDREIQRPGHRWQ